MHLSRAKTSKKLPITRKGTQYIARPLNYPFDSVSVLAAVRDMLHLARTAHEVNEMVKEKALKINGRVVRDVREPICLLNILEAGKHYRLTLLPTGRFALEETKDKTRFAKVVGKHIVKGGKVQINLHDGTNILTKEKINRGDSVEIDFENKIKHITPLAKGKKVFIIKGRNVGLKGTVSSVNGNVVEVSFDNHEATLSADQVVAI